MSRKTPSRKKTITKIVLITILIGLIGVNTSVLTTTTLIPCATAASPRVKWDITLKIDEPSGAGNTVVFGGATNASDGQDVYDMPAPPMPPVFPAISAWFDTPFPKPFDKLIYEYKHSPSSSTTWNLSILWLPAPADNTTTTISLHWDPAEVEKTPYTSFYLQENNTVPVNMLTQNTYSYVSNASLHRFQIICQNKASNNSSEQNTIPLLPLLIFILVLFIVIIIVILLLYIRGKKSRVSEKNKSPALEKKNSQTFEQNKSQVSEKNTLQISEKNKSQTVEKKKPQALKKNKSPVSEKKHKKPQKKPKRKNK